MPVIAICLAQILMHGTFGPSKRPWLDPTLPVPQRVQLLMDQMTVTERARQTYAVHNLPQFVGKFKEELGATSFGSLKLSAINTSIAAEQVC